MEKGNNIWFLLAINNGYGQHTFILGRSHGNFKFCEIILCNALIGFRTQIQKYPNHLYPQGVYWGISFEDCKSQQRWRCSMKEVLSIAGF